jgi:hypothetical protein
MEIAELCLAAERREALPILRELYPSLDEDRYAGLLAEMVVDGYRQFALRNETAEIVALARCLAMLGSPDGDGGKSVREDIRAQQAR